MGPLYDMRPDYQQKGDAMSGSSAEGSLSSVSDTVEGVSTPDNLSLSSFDSFDHTTNIPSPGTSTDNIPAVTVDTDTGSVISDNDSITNRSRAESGSDIHQTFGNLSVSSGDISTHGISTDNIPAVVDDTDSASVASDHDSVPNRTRAESRCDVQPTVEDVKQLLTCSACNQTYDKPKILVCLHSFCTKCIQTYREGKNDYVICSYCRTCQPMPPDGAEGLTPSYTYEDLLDITTTSQSKPSHCQACEKCVSPEFICTTCNVAICKTCQVAHANLKITKNHTVLSLSLASSTPLSIYAGKREVMCKEHSEVIAYRCVPCGLFLCHTDWKKAHGDHEIEGVVEVRQKMKRNAAELERKVKQSILSSKSAETLARCRREKLQSKFQAMEQKIDSVVAELERCMRVAGSDLKEELRLKKGNEDDNIQEVIRDAEKRLGSSQHLRRMLLSVTKESNDLDALTFVSYCEQKYEDSRQKGLAEKIQDSDIVLLKSRQLCHLLSSPTIGQVREIGKYPAFKPPKVIMSFEVIDNISGIAMNKYSEIMCTSYQERKAVMYDKRGRVVRDLSFQVVRPWDVAFTEEGTIVITDCGDTMGHGSVKLFSPAGSLTKVIEANVRSPAGVTIDRSGRMYVCYEHECFVKVTSMNGHIIGQLKTWNDEYLFHGPIYIAVNINNDVVVCDDHRSVKILSSIGEVKEKYDVDSRNDLQSVFVDKHGQILVVDNLMNGLHVLTSGGRLRRFVSLTEVAGLKHIRCACSTPAGYVLVAGSSKLVALDLFN